tara:strand:- start:286 stop:519 length:234 start_codon:yes stop_codon:yes gene_type:complete
MRKRFHKGLGGFRRSESLTSPVGELYDVIAVNKKTGEIKPIDKATTVDEAKQLVKNIEMGGFKFYFLENNTALIELV